MEQKICPSCGADIENHAGYLPTTITCTCGATLKLVAEAVLLGNGSFFHYEIA